MVNQFHKWMTLLALISAYAFINACSNSNEPEWKESRHATVKSSKLRASGSSDVNALSDFVAGQHALNIELFDHLPSDLQKKNAMISVQSIQQALGMTWGGAVGQTAAQMAEVLRFDEDTHSVLNAIDQALTSRVMPSVSTEYAQYDAVELSVVNAFWGRQGLNWKSDFLDLLAENYGTGIETLDFSEAPEVSRQFINAWVEESTRDRIQDLLPEGSISSETAAVLTNAVYFKAPWSDAFETMLTQQADFVRIDGTSIKASFMYEQRSLGYAEGEGWQAVEKPFRGEKLRMLFVLPSEGMFGAFASRFNDIGLDAIIAALTQTETKLWLPKFEFETDVPLKNIFIDMGMVLPFGSRADFSGMTDDIGLFIEEIFHKTFIAVDEKGAEAAAATAVVMGETSAPWPDQIEEFRADRPFFFAIRDAETGVFLFFGRVLDPLLP